MAEIRLKYRALAGDLCDALLLEETPRGMTIHVLFPQSSDKLKLTRIPLLARDDGRTRGVCFLVAA